MPCLRGVPNNAKPKVLTGGPARLCQLPSLVHLPWAGWHTNALEVTDRRRCTPSKGNRKHPPHGPAQDRGHRPGFLDSRSGKAQKLEVHFSKKGGEARLLRDRPLHLLEVV